VSKSVAATVAGGGPHGKGGRHMNVPGTTTEDRRHAANDGLPVRDPLPDLPPTARRILTAAQRVLVRDGFRDLTFQAVGAEAGENPALTRYYFGSKAGLIEALVDSGV
jgi:AcrR family transcriptional regulator